MERDTNSLDVGRRLFISLETSLGSLNFLWSAGEQVKSTLYDVYYTFLVYHSLALLSHPDACPCSVALNEHMVIRKSAIQNAVERRCNLFDPW